MQTGILPPTHKYPLDVLYMSYEGLNQGQTLDSSFPIYVQTRIAYEEPGAVTNGP